MKKQIRDTLLTALSSLPEFTTVRVGRRHRLAADQLPAVLIYTDAEELTRLSFNPVQYQHDVKLVLRLYIRPDNVNGGEDQADALSEIISGVVMDQIGALDDILDLVPESIEYEGDGTADTDYLMATLTYAVKYVSA